MVFNKLFGKKKEKKASPIPRSEFLQTRPVRNPSLKWEKTEKGDVKISIPSQQPKKKDVLSKLVSPPLKEKKIILDKVGSTVWELCDGENTIGDIADFLHKKYKMMLSEAEISLNTYFEQLSKRGLVGYILPKETRARFEEIAKSKKKKQ